MKKKDFKIKLKFNSELIKEKRISLGKTQKDVARDLDVSLSSFANWENGKTKPYMTGKSDIRHIAKYFGCDENDILIETKVEIVKSNPFDGEKLREIRNKRGYGRHKLVELCKEYCKENEINEKDASISKGSIIKYEKGERAPRKEVLKILAKVLEVSESELNK